MGKFTLIIVGFVLVAGLINSKAGNTPGPTPTPTTAARSPCDNTLAAYVMAGEFVRKTLKAPLTAQFPPFDPNMVRINPGCAFTVAGYVDAQNSFGALLRTRYWVRLYPSADGETWTSLSVIIDE
jgi:hypothetical protein